jgi:hypothetical protein
MLLPATCARPQTVPRRASGVLQLGRIFLNIQVEWRVVKLFDMACNAITFYHLEVFFAVFRIILSDFSVARRSCKPFVFLVLSVIFTRHRLSNPALSHRDQFTMLTTQPGEVFRLRALPLGWRSLPPFTCDTLAKNSCSSLF